VATEKEKGQSKKKRANEKKGRIGRTKGATVEDSQTGGKALTQRIRVLHVLRQASGGMREHVTTLLKKMDSSRYSLMVACPRNTIVDRELVSTGVKIFYVDICEGSSLISNVKCLVRLIKILRENRIQVVHCHGARAGLIGRAAPLLTGTPVVLYTVHNFVKQSSVAGWKKRLFAFAEKVLEPVTSRYIAVSRALRAEMVREFGIPGEKIEVVYNGVDLNRFNIMLDCKEKKQQLGLDPHGLIIGTAGRLIATKGVSYFIKAARLVKEKFPAAQFIIVGEGPERPALERLAKDIGMAEDIFFLGFRLDLLAILPLINVFVVPSISEGQSIMTLEAMAARRPIVAFETGGIPELLHHYRTGILVRERDSEHLAKGILTVLNNPLLAEKLGNRARTMVEEKFRQERMVQETEAVYRQCLEEKGFLDQVMFSGGDTYTGKLAEAKFYSDNKQ